MSADTGVHRTRVVLHSHLVSVPNMQMILFIQNFPTASWGPQEIETLLAEAYVKLFCIQECMQYWHVTENVALASFDNLDGYVSGVWWIQIRFEISISFSSQAFKLNCS